MPDVSSRRFVEVFQKAIQKSGRLTDADVSALKTAQKALTNTKDQAAAASVMAMLSHDHELDAFEVAPAKKALAALLGITHGPLPKDLEKVLTHAVPAANVEVKHYDLSFDLTGKGPSFPAKAIVELDAPAKKDTVLEANPDRLAIKSVLADGKSVPFRLVDGRLHVTAPGAKALAITYTVKAEDKVSEEAYGLIRDKYTGRIWTMTWPYNTGALFPSNSAPKDGSTTRVTVRIGAGEQVVGTGTQGADGSFSTQSEAPAYATAFYAAKDFQLGDSGLSKDGVDVSSYGMPQVPQKNRDAYSATAKQALDFYAGWLGKYDYGDTLKLVEAKGGLGGMEHTGAVAIMLASAKDVGFAQETAAHETAHHWFGDNVRIATWGDFWMSEGFTNYATYRFFRASEGEGKYHQLLDRSKTAVRDQLEANPHALSVAPNTDVNEIFDDVPYELGPWMLRMMEVKLGTPAFDSLLKDWFHAKRQKAVTTSEFVAFAKQKTGHDFAPFFDAWNGITAVPSFTSDVKAHGSTVSVTMAAKTPVPKGITVPLVLEGDGGKTKSVQIDPTKPFSVDASFPVKSWKWDPDRTVLAVVK